MTGFFMAWQMFLWIPCPFNKWDQTKRKEMLLWMPIIGLIIGALWYLIYILIAKLGFVPILIALFAVFPWLITGFMHMDGYMDCSDSFLYFGKQEKKMEILKDSHVGSFAVICTVILGIFQYAAASQAADMLNNTTALALIFIPAISRVLPVLCIFNWDCLSHSSYEGIKQDAEIKHSIISLCTLILCFTAVFLLSGTKILLSLAIGTIVEYIILLALKKNLGGMSGDVSGAAITAGELALLTALAFA